ncbi:MAG: MerR family transcriptional regulator [Deltaproteobacteria bacterium]|nr:MerR family transcriptional regulator [Deltaproteobacteria bacterium]
MSQAQTKKPETDEETTDEVERVKMSKLARMSGVPAATIKHYVKEGLLPEPQRTSRNMAYYPVSLVPRIRAIKELQSTRYLPLKVIKEVLDEAAATGITLGQAVEAVLRRQAGDEFKTREELLEAGVPKGQLEAFESFGLVEMVERDGKQGFTGDDLSLLRVLGSARRAGITQEMLPYTILQPYMKAVRDLAELELDLFEKGVAPHAGDELQHLVLVASELSERLVVVLRRKMLTSLARQRRS